MRDLRHQLHIAHNHHLEPQFLCHHPVILYNLKKRKMQTSTQMLVQELISANEIMILTVKYYKEKQSLNIFLDSVTMLQIVENKVTTAVKIIAAGKTSISHTTTAKLDPRMVKR